MASPGRPRTNFPKPLHCCACLRFIRIPNKTCIGEHFCSPECNYWGRVIIPKSEDYADQCWKWSGVRNHFGHAYSRRLVPDKKGRHGGVSAHSVSYELFVGPVPKGLVVRHLCPTRDCTNPNHLLLGTYQDNSSDMIKANNWRSGTRRHYVTHQQVMNIFNAPGQYKDIAKQFNFSAAVVGAIKTGVSHWKQTGLERRCYGIKKKYDPPINEN